MSAPPTSPAPRKMGRPRRAVDLPRQFISRVTEGEFAAIGTLVALWSDKARAQGFPVASDNRTAWFRALIQRECAAEGVEIVEPAALPSDPEAAPAAAGVEVVEPAAPRPEAAPAAPARPSEPAAVPAAPAAAPSVLAPAKPGKRRR